MSIDPDLLLLRPPTGVAGLRTEQRQVLSLHDEQALLACITSREEP